MDAYKLRPVSLVGADGKEVNALTHEAQLQSYDSSSMQVSPVLPLAKKQKDDSTAFSLNASLFDALSSGPFRKHFLNDCYTEVNDDVASFINEDWTFYPTMRYACSRLLAGAILLNTSNGRALVANTVEVYGRDRNIDSHRESFRELKNANVTNSLPPVGARYTNVWMTTINDPDGQKLVIGTNVFDAPITSSLRLDAHSQPEVGPTTKNFVLSTHHDSMSTRLFIKETAWLAAQKLATAKDVSQITRHDTLCQLRQLRTCFHHESTYLRCRSSNEQTDNLAKRPYTVFTLASYDSASEDAGYRIASLLFRQLAIDVITGNGFLAKQEVRALQKRLKSGEVYNVLQSILQLFDGDTTSIPIIGDNDLNKYMQMLAKLLAGPISVANESIVKAISRTYE